MIRRSRIGVAFFIASVFLGCVRPRTSARIERVSRYSVPGSDLSRIRWSPNGRWLAVTSQRHELDLERGDRVHAALVSELQRRVEQGPRSANPVAHVLDSGREVCQLEWGYVDDIEDDGRVLLSYPTRPIVSERGGDELRLYDCSTNGMRVLARAEEGWIEHARFFDQGRQVIYALADRVQNENDAIVALAAVGVAGGPSQMLVPRRRIGQCNDLLLGPAVDRAKGAGEIVFIAETPHDNRCEDGMTRYDAALRRGRGGVTEVARLGSDEEHAYHRLQANASGKVMVWAGRWQQVSFAGPFRTRRRNGDSTQEASAYTSDQRFYATPIASSRDEGGWPTRVVIRDARSGETLGAINVRGEQSGPNAAQVREIVWSDDGHQVAVVVTRRPALTFGNDANAHLPYDELLQFQLNLP